MRLLTTTIALLLLSSPAFAEDEMPAPAPELVAQAKVMKGTWSCNGTLVDPTGASSKIKGTIKWSLDLDKMWIKGVMSLAKMKGQKRGYKAIFYRTFSNGAWSQLAIGNMGDWGSATSKGADADGKLTLEGTSHAAGMSWQTKDYEEKGEKKGTFHIWGEASMDGQTFSPAYDMVCKK